MKLQKIVVSASLIALVALALVSGTTRGEEISQEVVFNLVREMDINPQLKDNLIKGLERAFSLGIVTEEKTAAALEQIGNEGYNTETSQDLLSVLAEALAEGLPVNQLLNELTEGIGRGVSGSRVESVLRRWKIRMSQVKSLLEEKGLTVGSSTPTEGDLTRATLYTIIEDVTVSLEQSALQEPNPERDKGEELKAGVIGVLREDGRISAPLVELVKDRISSNELSNLVQNFNQE